MITAEGRAIAFETQRGLELRQTARSARAENRRSNARAGSPRMQGADRELLVTDDAVRRAEPVRVRSCLAIHGAPMGQAAGR